MKKVKNNKANSSSKVERKLLRSEKSEIKRMLLRDYRKRRLRSRALPLEIIKGIAVSRHIVPVITGDLYLPYTALNKGFFASVS